MPAPPVGALAGFARKPLTLGMRRLPRRLAALIVLVACFAPAASIHAAEPLTCEDVEVRMEGVPDTEQAVVVAMDFVILELLDIDDSEGTFDVDMLVSARWKDPRVTAGLASQWRSCDGVGERTWRPPVSYGNGYDAEVRVVEPLRLERDDAFFYRERQRVTFSLQADLHAFPFDEQVLSMQIINPVADADMHIEPSVSMSAEATAGIVGWHVAPPGIDRRAFLGSAPHGGRVVGPQFTQFRVLIPVSRDPRFYLWRVVLPLCLIVGMSWSVFWIHSSRLDAQMEVSSASVLTLIAFQLSFSDVLPRVPYLTLLDKFALMCTLLVFLALAESVWTSFLARRERLELAERIDHGSRWAFPLAFSAWIACMALTLR